MKQKSYAKINIGLQVLNLRPDGYHNLNTLFQELEFNDIITLTKGNDGCSLSSNADNFPLDKTNTCKKAYGLLKEIFPKMGGVNIHVEKNIPQGGGLGGGSSNGATILKGLNSLFELGLSHDELEKLASKIGADVPFFIRGGTQLGEGRGEILTPLYPHFHYTFLLAMPVVSISTPWAYSALKKELDEKKETINFADLLKGEQFPFELFQNDFERIVIPAHPEIGECKDSLMKNGALFASLSGSGSTVFGVFDDDATARVAESALPSSTRTILTQPTNL